MRLEPGTWPLSHLCFLPVGPPVISGGWAGGRFETCPRLCGSSSFSSLGFCEMICRRSHSCPGMETLNAQPHRSLYIITSFGGKRASGLICWHFISGDWNWNLPNHLLVFHQGHPSSHETTAWFLPGACNPSSSLLPSCSAWRLHPLLGGGLPGLWGELAAGVSRWAHRILRSLHCAASRAVYCDRPVPLSAAGEGR